MKERLLTNSIFNGGPGGPLMTAVETGICERATVNK